MAAWREAPYFTDAERAALALTEAVTRLSDRADPVPDEIWDEAARHYDERGLAALILMIATTNVFNRLNVTTRQVGRHVGLRAPRRTGGCHDDTRPPGRRSSARQTRCAGSRTTSTRGWPRPTRTPGPPYLVPLSFLWDGGTVLISHPGRQPDQPQPAGHGQGAAGHRPHP